MPNVLAEPYVQALVGAEPFKVVDVAVTGDPAAHGSWHSQAGQVTWSRSSGSMSSTTTDIVHTERLGWNCLVHRPV
jgi:hypothetical protein